jgi:membrane AbrB-like protein
MQARFPRLADLASSRSRILRGVAGVALGTAAGWLCDTLSTPIPWMLGPLFALALLRVAGTKVGALPGGREAGQWIIGTALGLYFTPQVTGQIVGWWPLLAAGAVFAIALGYAGGRILARLAGLDRTTGIFASVPGGASEMAVLGERFGARVDRVAAAQSLRILIVVAVIPAVYAALGVHGSDLYVPGSRTFSPGGFALLLAATAVGGAAAARLRVPNAFMLGALAVAIPMTALEVDLSAIPTLASNAGQVLLGSALGARFEPDFVRGAPRFVAAVSATVLGAIALSAAFGWTMAQVFALNPATLVLGTAPGGVAEMCITAKVLQLGVPLVTAFHVTRLVVLLLCTAPLYARVRAWRERDRVERR